MQVIKAFSDEVRDKIDAMPIGREFKMKELAKELGVVPEDYRKRASRISSILTEKISIGSLIKTDYGNYKKVATIKTVSKRPWSTIKGSKGQGHSRQKRTVYMGQRLVIYRGDIYPDVKKFCKIFKMTITQLYGYVERGFFNKFAIFTTRTDDLKTANYYAENFANAQHIRTNQRDRVEDYED